MNDSKKCSGCGVVLPASKYHVNRRNKGGLQSRCKDCTKAAYYTPHKEKRLESSRRRRQEEGGRAREAAWQRENRRSRPLVRMVQEAKVRAAKKGLPFDLTADDLSIPETCPVLGIPIGMAYGSRSENSLSIDRIECAKGYVRGNVMVISWRANRLKSDATVDELQKIAAFYAAHAQL
jgi:hypothetical protein